MSRDQRNVLQFQNGVFLLKNTAANFFLLYLRHQPTAVPISSFQLKSRYNHSISELSICNYAWYTLFIVDYNHSEFCLASNFLPIDSSQYLSGLCFLDKRPEFNPAVKIFIFGDFIWIRVTISEHHGRLIYWKPTRKICFLRRNRGKLASHVETHPRWNHVFLALLKFYLLELQTPWRLHPLLHRELR